MWLPGQEQKVNYFASPVIPLALMAEMVIGFKSSVQYPGVIGTFNARNDDIPSPWLNATPRLPRGATLNRAYNPAVVDLYGVTHER